MVSWILDAVVIPMSTDCSTQHPHPERRKLLSPNLPPAQWGRSDWNHDTAHPDQKSSHPFPGLKSFTLYPAKLLAQLLLALVEQG